MNMRFFSSVFCSIAGGLCVGALAGPAQADLLVTESSVATYKIDAKLSDDVKLNVPAGGQLKLMKTPENATHTIDGPYEGTLSGYANRKRSLWEQVFGTKRKSPGPTPGAVPGGVRGIPPAESEKGAGN